MRFIEKKSDYDYIINLYVKTNSHHQEIQNDGKFLAVSLKSKPIRNKANKELIKLLSKKLKVSSSQISIISGMTNQDKIVKLFFEEPKDVGTIQKLLFK
ncbi:MAG: hypothetical protein GF317_22510 [Candidatus Lokiarchaeota archaeon]|nr:hypothetical protein [Candidatus Lokiarchaeota archaeon]MBD3202234.1 hypothetical protein [Candidatus Lokiarchaeota archaeon]